MSCFFQTSVKTDDSKATATKIEKFESGYRFSFLENNSEQSVDEYIDFLLQHLENKR